tara:strand:+ start:5537 stop:6103 length:567 start_codon:yes stop_codon:yes gene_type:complete
MFHKYNIYYFIDSFDSEEIKNLDKKINIIFRNYKQSDLDYTIRDLSFFCKKYNQKLFISNNSYLARKYSLNGLYIPSFNKLDNFKNINFKKNFKIIGSAHNEQEIIIKKKQGCSQIFISPIFKTKKKEKFLDIVRFNKVNLNNSKGIIALGGVNEKNFKSIKLTKALGFASIDWIKKNRPKNLGRFLK